MKLKTSDIVIDSRIQLSKRHVDETTVQDYVVAILSGAILPPVTVFQSDGQFMLADGFHRLAAYRFLNHTEVEVEIKQGSEKDAKVYAAVANVANGRPMSRAEKREAGKRLLKLTDWSQHEIARKLAIAQQTVSNWERDLSNKKLLDRLPRTVTRGDTVYKMNVSNIGNEKQAKELSKPTMAKPEPSGLSESINLVHGDFAKVCLILKPESFDAIITDPLYSKEYLHLYELLAEEAARLLKPGGSLLAMAGQFYLPTIYFNMVKHLTYHWTLCYLTPGGQSPAAVSNLKRVNTFWKPVLWFVKGKYKGNQVGDVIKSDRNDKRYHEFGQSERGMAELVDKVTSPGDWVLDPFLGGGTTAVVCHKLGRRFTGIDIDLESIETTRRRLSS